MLGFVPSWHTTGGDFANYYTASRLTLEGIPLENAYWDFSWFQKHMDRYGIRNQVGGFTPQPPAASLPLLPLAHLPPGVAKKIWLLTNVALGVLCVGLLSRLSGLPVLVCSLIVVGSSYGLINNFLFGQLYLLVLLLILLGLSSARAGRSGLAGISLGALIALKYVGLPFVLLLTVKGKRRVGLAAALTLAGVLAVSLWLHGWPTYQTFLTEVLPRHWQGEIQDPYAVGFQSWNSLFRRLFLGEPSLNPFPVVHSPLAYFGFKNLTFWTVAAGAMALLWGSGPMSRRHRWLFQAAVVATAILVLSPAAATYHFLLLTIPTTFLVRILLDLKRKGTATLLVLLHMGINVPLYLHVSHLAQGYGNLLAYPRLVGLTLFSLLAILAVRKQLRQARLWPAWIPLVAVLAALQTVMNDRAYRRTPTDAARPVPFSSPALDPSLDLIVGSPDRGTNKTIFSYCQLLVERYAIFSTRGERLTPDTTANFYHPDLARDDRKLLVETVREGRSEIWVSRDETASLSLATPGSSARWHPSGTEFVLARGGKLGRYDLDRRVWEPLPTSDFCYDPSYSPEGEAILYCSIAGERTRLCYLRLDQDAPQILFETRGRMQAPRMSPDGGKIVFSGRFQEHGGNWDIWGLTLARRALIRVTYHRAIDRSPIWDRNGSRILFVSDRGRGLGCTTLFRIPWPGEVG